MSEASSAVNELATVFMQWEERQPTLLDQFAMAALTGMTANLNDHAVSSDALASRAYRLGVAMLKAKVKTEAQDDG